MANPIDYRAINSLFVDVSRSLLQYVDECWPWTPVTDSDTRAALGELAARQREHATALYAVLDERGWTIAAGTYPTAYTDLHYVALDYLLAELIGNAQTITNAVIDGRDNVREDATLSGLLNRVVGDEQAIVESLTKLRQGQSSASAAAG